MEVSTELAWRVGSNLYGLFVFMDSNINPVKKRKEKKDDQKKTVLNIMLVTLAVISISSFVSLHPAIAHSEEEDDSGEHEGVQTREDGSIQRAPTEEHHEAAAELGHKLHPIHAANQARIYGWLTAIAQGTIGSKDDTGRKNDKAEGSLSGDIFYEASLNESGRFTIHLDIQQGKGLVHIPPLFTSPNGNPTG